MIAEPIRYRLTFPRLKEHVLHVSAVFPTQPLPGNWDGLEGVSPAGSPLLLMLPTWTPGSYLIREYARHVESIHAWDEASGAALRISKVSKNQWLVQPQGAQRIRVEYAVYGRELSVRTNWIDDEFAVIQGAATFITRDDAMNYPHEVAIEPPAAWPHIACSLPVAVTGESNGKLQGDVRTAKDYHTLVDSPILLGDLEVRAFEVGDKPHYLVGFKDSEAWDLDQAAVDCQKIVAYEQQFWGEVPYPQYWFLNLALEGYGGLEHDDNTLLLCNRWAMRKRQSYVEWLGLVSHEFFHTWNVRRLRPRRLMDYDYHQEQCTEELWIAEGITSYFDDLVLLRTGLISPEEYLGLLAKTIQQVEEAPGRLVQSLRDSSWDTWIKHYRPDESTPNSRISYYTKGAVVAFLLDVEIRRRSQEKLALDDVMRQLWKEFRLSGYSLRDFEQIVSELCGAEMQAWFEQHVYQPKQLVYAAAWEWLGLERTEAEAATQQASSHGSEWDIGCDLANRDGRWITTRVYRDGPAAAAGIQVDDEWLAIQGWRLPREGWKDRLQSVAGNGPLQLTIARRQRLRELTIEPRRKNSWNLRFADQATACQRKHRRDWLYWGVLSSPASPYFD
jgi:predicted metalloprotease with PDZ domain